MSAISTSEDRGEIIQINGMPEGFFRSNIDGAYVTQLHKLLRKKIDYPWQGRNVKEIVIRDTLIYDTEDVNCLVELIARHITLNLAASFVSPSALLKLDQACDRLLLKSREGIAQGSTITLPLVRDEASMSIAYRVREKLQKLGFTVPQW